MVNPATPADVFRHYYASLHDTVLWKLEGLSERQLRMPLTPTGSNLLGIVKHLAAVEFGYFADCTGRGGGPDFGPLFGPDAPPNADLFARADEPSSQIVDLFRRAGQYADETFAELPLDAPATVPWWPPDRRDVTLQRLAVHMLVELGRHAGHLDILRELTDQQAGLSRANDNLPHEGHIDWTTHVAELRAIAESFDTTPPQQLP